MTSVLFYHSVTSLHLHAFPTRRSSDLHHARQNLLTTPRAALSGNARAQVISAPRRAVPPHPGRAHYGDTGNRDRKSTRLNSSHVAISYAVFCLKKKKRVYSHLSRMEYY